MQDLGSVSAGPGFGTGRLVMAQALGLAMARRAADILDRHRDVLTRPIPEAQSTEGQSPHAKGLDPSQFALDDAIFTAVLDATNECLGRFDPRPPADRWCDALLHLLDLARNSAEAGL